MTGFATDLGAWLAAHHTELDPYRHRADGGIAAAVEHDRGLLRLLHDAGWSRWGWPEAAGGLGGPVALRAVLYDELTAADVEIPEVFVILETLGPVLVEYAPHLATRHLPAYLVGDELWGQGFSEPEAGSDLAALRTKAVPTPTGFRLTGQKTWTTLGQFARYAAVLARTGTPESAHRGLSLLWVDLEADGVEVRPIRAANGRDEFAELFFDDVEVPREHLIGDLDGGWGVAMFLLQYERGMYAWQRQATLHRRLGQAAAAAAADPADPVGLGALGAGYLAATALRARSSGTVQRLSAGENPGPEISVDKILLSRAEQATFDAARTVAWSRTALSEDAEAATLREEWFYSRASSIFGGAVDVQRDIVAEHVLGLPRERRRGR
jgi:acyl-CoA dehydrogenase